MEKRFLNGLNFKEKEVKKMRKFLLACAVVAIVALSATQVLAFSFAYNYVGDVLIKYDNFEQYVPGYTAMLDTVGLGAGGTNYFANAPTGGQDLYGILKVKSIAPIGGGPNLWWDGKDNEEITGYFKDLMVTKFVAAPILGDDDVVFSIMYGAVSGTTPTLFTFLDTPGDLNVDGASAGIVGAPLIPGSAIDGVPFLNMQFTPGIIVGDLVTLINSTYSTISDPNNGTGFFLGTIVGGNYTRVMTRTAL